MKKKGFTLVEIILSVSLVGILFIFAGLLLRSGLDAYTHLSQRGANLQASRFAMDRMIRELIQVEDDNPNNIQSIQSNRIVFVDSLGITSDFELIGQNIMRNNDILLGNVTSLTFTGFASDNSITTAAPQVRRVRIQFSTLPPGQTAPLTLRTDIFVRNYMYDNFN